MAVIESRPKAEPQSPKPETQPEAKSGENSSTANTSKVLVCYFHTTARCQTCRKFEAYSKETLHNTFSEELADGRLEWKMINVDEPANEHFIKDYQLYSKSIVIVKMQNGKELKWKNLDEIWKLVRNKDDFINYIQNQVRDYLETN
jgi:hypothetical protein